MADKVKLTKSELKNQKDKLKRFKRYLPTLQLKKQQLQSEIRQREIDAERKKAEQADFRQSLESWIEMFSEPFPFEQYLEFISVKKAWTSVAGVAIPVFQGAEFKKHPYSLVKTALWIDSGIDALEAMLRLSLEYKIIQEQMRILSEELRITSQRVNLFEKVMIPQTTRHIKRINIYLGDQQTASVVRGKIAKSNLVRSSQEAQV